MVGEMRVAEGLRRVEQGAEHAQEQRGRTQGRPQVTAPLRPPGRQPGLLRGKAANPDLCLVITEGACASRCVDSLRIAQAVQKWVATAKFSEARSFRPSFHVFF